MPHRVQTEPFPQDIAVADLPRISYSKLLARDEKESNTFFASCQDRGIFLLDLSDGARGSELLETAEQMFEVARHTFALESEVKMEYKLDWKTINGYKSAGMGTVDRKGTPDRCEFYTVGRDELTGVSPARPQPTPIEEGKPTLRNFVAQSEDVAAELLRLLDAHLQLPAGTLASKHDPNKTSGSQTRMLHYDPQPEHDRRTSLVAHTDLGTITILFNVLGGLQIFKDATKPEADDNWVHIKPESGCAIVNVGDALEKWTNGLLKSPKHRVTFAPGAQATINRYSVAYFVRPQHDALMARLDGGNVIPPLADGKPEEPITAQEWHFKMSAIHAAKNKS